MCEVNGIHYTKITVFSSTENCGMPHCILQITFKTGKISRKISALNQDLCTLVQIFNKKVNNFCYLSHILQDVAVVPVTIC